MSNEIEGRLEVKFGHEQNLIHNLAHGSQADLFLLIINRATNVVVTERRFAFKEGGFVLVNN